ncbi:Cytochrome P450 monooxygenase FUM15 [Colletotrichum siamense]|nr:Cytochrome P450 monooxygenase FUM15 [Colletotrichum siamense]
MSYSKHSWQYAVITLTGAAAVLPSLHMTPWQLVAQGLLACLAVSYCAMASYNLFIYPYYVSPLRHLPGPTDHHFLLGHTVKQFLSGDPREPYVTWLKRWPKEPFIRFMGFGNSESLLVTSLDAFKEIYLPKSYTYIKPEFSKRLMAPVLGYGLIFQEGDEARTQRKLISALFGLTSIKRTIPTFQKKAKRICQLFDQKIENENGLVNVSSAWSSVALDVISEFTLGIDLQTTLTPSVFHESYNQCFDPSTFGCILIAIYAIFPAIRSFPLEENRKYKAANALVRSEIRKLIQMREAELADKQLGSDDTPNVLTHMLLESKAMGHPLSEDQILQNILNFFAAGHETSATTMVWCTHMLTRHPDIQEKVRQEVTELITRKPNPDYYDLESLHYTDNVLKETLRLCSPGIVAAREPVHDVEICGTIVPKGTPLVLMPTIVNRNPMIWGEDADEFRPERWDNLTGESSDPHAMTSFLMGPRSCIGRAFAMLEMKMILVEVMSKFKLEPAVEERDIILVNPSPALRVKGGLKVNVSRL